MKEIEGNLWDYYGKVGYKVLVTTNGFVKKNGEAVMGRGCAAEAARKFPYLPKQLGTLIQAQGNRVHSLQEQLLSFPVKHNWWEKADLDLIAKSQVSLRTLAQSLPSVVFILPRPGCGNGQLTWEQVRPLFVDMPDNVWIITKKEKP